MTDNKTFPAITPTDIDRFIWSAYYGNVDNLKAMLEQCGPAIINAKNKHNYTALMAASKAGKKEALLFLLKNGADINLKGHKKYTALMHAADNDIARILLEHGAEHTDAKASVRMEIDTPSIEKFVGLAMGGNLDEMKIMVAKFGYKITNKRKMNGETALIAATGCISTSGVHKDIIRFLLNNGAKPDNKHRQLTPLMHAAIHGDTDVAEILLEHGAKHDLKVEGKSAASCAEQIKRPDLAHLISHWPEIKRERERKIMIEQMQKGLAEPLPYKGPIKVIKRGPT